jgi:hypothetical protein
MTWSHSSNRRGCSLEESWCYGMVWYGTLASSQCAASCLWFGVCCNKATSAHGPPRWFGPTTQNKTMILHSWAWDGFIFVHESEKAHNIIDGPVTWCDPGLAQYKNRNVNIPRPTILASNSFLIQPQFLSQTCISIPNGIPNLWVFII